MSRTFKVLVGAGAALAVGVVGQVAVNNQHHEEQPTYKAAWTFQPTSAKEVQRKAKTIVLGEVVAVERGADIVTKQPQEPSGEDRIPTTRVTIEVVKSYKGTAKAGEQITLFQTGAALKTPKAPAKKTKGEPKKANVHQVLLEGDPAYVNGEEYLLMLEGGPGKTLRPVSPEGRYRYDKDTDALKSVVNNKVTKEVTGKRLASAEQSLRAK